LESLELELDLSAAGVDFSDLSDFSDFSDDPELAESELDEELPDELLADSRLSLR
jgi:hypothetical protein